MLVAHEHHIVHNDNDHGIVFKKFDKDIFVTCLAWRTCSNVASGGNGTIVNKKASATPTNVV